MPATGRPPHQPDLVVFSHLRWDFVWQRPQHLISRIAAGSRRTWFVEEPKIVPGAREVTVREQIDGPVTRMWLEVPGDERHCGHGDDQVEAYEHLLCERLGHAADRVAWLYTPMALPCALSTSPSVLVYDVMDDLASFAHAPPKLRNRQLEALSTADVVFTGGRSLQRGVLPHRPDARCFPSGVEPEHYEQARDLRRAGRRPVAGYVGVVDERLDLDLVAGLADALPDWTIRIVGPVLKIDEASLPRRANLEYPGQCAYADLPPVMAGFDVALMPFARNEATESISPTKTLEYLAAGLPVVSTRIPDVVADFHSVVDLQDDAEGFADACRGVLGDDLHDRDGKLRPLLERGRWDAIAARMAAAIEEAAAAAPAAERTPA